MRFLKRLIILFGTAVILFFYYFLSADEPVSLPSFVDGWYPNTSKNASDYISEIIKPHIMPRNFCSEKKLLVVFVHIRVDDFERRNTIRETWGRPHENITFYFLLGENKTKSYKEELIEESQKYNDIIQERFIDTYNNLTLKSINMLKLFTLYCSKSYNFLLKIDGDVFLNLANFLKMLDRRVNDTNLLIAKLFNNTKPYRNTDSKWFVPYELYPDEYYPAYLCGAAYLMSSEVAKKLYYCSLETPIFYIEDIYITGICAKKVNIVPKNDSMFTCDHMNKYVCLHRDLYTIHYYEPNEIRESFQILKEGRCYPPGSFKEWLHSSSFLRRYLT